MVCKQPIMGGTNITTVTYPAGGLTDCHLVYHSILHTSWRISFTLYAFCSGPGVERAKTLRHVEVAVLKSAEARCRNGSVQANQGSQRLHKK